MSKKFVTIDGNYAAAYVAYAFSEVAAIYPITPSSTMGEYADEWAAKGKKNIFGHTLDIVEMQSEGGAAGAVHGSLTAGSLTTTFTASQGLLLMIPNMYKIAGELLPSVFHVSARTLATHSLSIFGDHSDVMSCRMTGWAMIAEGSIQETMDLATVSHLATLETRIPFLAFFDGFRTSHEIQKIEVIEQDVLKDLFNEDDLRAFRSNGLRPEKPVIKVGAQNPDVFFQGRETCNKYYDAVPAAVQKHMDRLAEKTGRHYHLFDFYGAADAEKAIIMMGSATHAAMEAIDYMNAHGEKVGMVMVRLYRPFSVKHFVDSLPKTVKKIAVLDRTKEPGAIGEPLFMDVRASISDPSIMLIGGRYGLSSKEFTPSMVKAVYDHLDNGKWHGFTVGINDDVTNLSIPMTEHFNAEDDSVISCKFWGLGSDGTVGANKNSIKIIGDHTDLYAQGYFSYDSKKSGGITVSHLRFGPKEIRSPYLVTHPQFVACHNPSYIGRYELLDGIQEGGTFLLNSEFSNEEVFSKLTKDLQETIINKKLKFYNIDALKIAKSVGLGNRINTVMQTAFFNLAAVIPFKDAVTYMKGAIEKTFAKKGQNVVDMNCNAIDHALEGLHEVVVPDSITESAPAVEVLRGEKSAWIKNVVEPIVRLKGDDIPVSKMPVDGSMEPSITKMEKRRVSPIVAHWIPENCIQCNQCSLACPHGVIRPKMIDPAALEGAPVELPVRDIRKSDLKYTLQIYAEDCTGCGVCIETCPAKTKALGFASLTDELAAGAIEKVNFFETLPERMDGNKESSVKGSQFKRPLFEFSGACAGCGETPYVKLTTQLFGDRMIIANATGCTSIYGGTFPSAPYTTNDEGHGPAWANSLFEDNAEYGLGMRLSVNQNRLQLKTKLDLVADLDLDAGFKAAVATFLPLFKNVDDEAKAAAKAVKAALPKALAAASSDVKAVLRKIEELIDYLIEKSVWIFGGDGWAYDIGFGGLDHVLASGNNVNVLVVDTEVYSNTGGQSSKSSPLGSVAKFAAAGKERPKKNLAMMAMSYGYVYVATVSMGANKNQVLKAFTEAEQYDGPSIIIAYSPCIAHGFSLKKAPEHQKIAVETGYFPIYRFNPMLAADGKNPFVLDSKTMKGDFEAFLLSETRYKTLKNADPERADKMFSKAKDLAEDRFSQLQKFASIFDKDEK